LIQIAQGFEPAQSIARPQYRVGLGRRDARNFQQTPPVGRVQVDSPPAQSQQTVPGFLVDVVIKEAILDVRYSQNGASWRAWGGKGWRRTGNDDQADGNREQVMPSSTAFNTSGRTFGSGM
jgi:hypothetical protein